MVKVVSMQGSVQVRKASETQWIPAKLNDTYCPDDMIWVKERSRAAVVLPNESILRLDQNTTITFSGLENGQTSLFELVKGVVHFFSRVPRSLKLTTPFVNGVVEGTEFIAHVESDQTFLSIFEGRVVASNAFGTLVLASGQSAVARAGQPPMPHVVVRPRDAAQWALYYPPIVEYRMADFPGADWQAMVRESIQFYQEGDLVKAFSSLKRAPKDIRDPRFFTYRAGLLLTVGRVEEASVDIERALNLDPSNGYAFALQSIIAVVQNKKKTALELADKAVALDGKSSAPRVARSYAQQAHFDLQGALTSMQEAVDMAPENALSWARLAELWLSVDYLDKALEAAKKAVALNSKLARTQTVLGFAYLTKIKVEESKDAFNKAIELDQAAPLPRLGLGLAKIREGDLKAGRAEIEIAVSLDPGNALIRSYLGKAYFEEKRDKLARGQFDISKELDPLDPTPYFYDAIRKQTINRPVEALHDLQKSIELNDNRAVYRSRLLLDGDLAARSASLGRIYQDLGFKQLALVEGWKSLNTDPGSHSAHRFLADTYSTLPRHEIARVSELLQSQLLQPLNITPVQPRLAETNLFILEGAGPADLASNEFNTLFNRNRLALQASGVAGGKDTWGNELVHSAVWGRWSYSIGQFHHETDGFRVNNDLEQNIYNGFVQLSTSEKTTSVQAEFRSSDKKNGDLPRRFYPTNVQTTRQDQEADTIRLGFRHAFTPRSDLIASFIYRSDEGQSDTPPILNIKIDQDGYTSEVQHLFRSERFRITSGVGYFDSDEDEVITLTVPLPVPPFAITDVTKNERNIHHTNLYAYSQVNYPRNVTWTIGASADFLEDGTVDRDQLNPKFGVLWNPFPDTTLRGAVFRTLKRNLISDQTVEPTQVAGFNQFFDDPSATKAWRYGIGVDQQFSPSWFGGAEYTKRDLDSPFTDTATNEIRETGEDEVMARAYLYWTPLSSLAASVEYQYEEFKRSPDNPGEESIVEVDTHRFPLGLRFFHPSGFSAGLKATYFDQDGIFGTGGAGYLPGDDQFWVVDASVSYRLPKRYGLITVEVKNLFDEEFNYTDMEYRNPVVAPESFILARVTLAF
jgi:tetratricopeptide (TPR) repeat protein